MWVRVADEADLPEGESAVGVTHAGKRLALFRLEAGVYALDDVCSHEFSLLSEGEIWDRDVYCPKHGSRFSIQTGAVQGLPATEPVQAYPAKVEDGGIYVELGE